MTDGQKALVKVFLGMTGYGIGMGLVCKGAYDTGNVVSYATVNKLTDDDVKDFKRGMLETVGGLGLTCVGGALLGTAFSESYAAGCTDTIQTIQNGGMTIATSLASGVESLTEGLTQTQQ